MSLLYRWNCDMCPAETLRGKTVPDERVRSLLERGELLGPGTCGWHYAEGLTTSDNPELAIVWDKVGLGHNGQDLYGGHSVWLKDGPERVIPATAWPEFLRRQEELMALRTHNTKQPQRPSTPDGDRASD